MAVFAHAIVRAWEANITQRFPKLFAFVEEQLGIGDPDVAELLTIRLLEDIQTIGSWEGNTEAFLKWLGPKSKGAWREIERAWAGNGSLASALRAEVNKGREDI